MKTSMKELSSSCKKDLNLKGVYDPNVKSVKWEESKNLSMNGIYFNTKTKR